MNHRITTIAAIAALTLAACGGGSDSGGSDDGGSAGGAASDFAAPTMTADEVCAAVPGEQFVPSVADATGVIDTPSITGIGCSFQFANLEGSVVDAAVTIENEGGQAGYDAYVADWSTRGDATELPGVGDAATIVENSSIRRVIVLDGERVLWINGPANDSFPFTVDLATEMAVAAAAAL